MITTRTRKCKDDSSFEQEGDYVATISVGHNANENDMLFKNAHCDDIWFHLASGPSAHVYLHVDSGTISKRNYLTLLHECADFVRKYSKCCYNASVNYLPRRYLYKDAQCKQGEVILKKSPKRL